VLVQVLAAVLYLSYCHTNGTMWSTNTDGVPELLPHQWGRCGPQLQTACCDTGRTRADAGARRGRTYLTHRSDV
jgi:hypothetical protein